MISAADIGKRVLDSAGRVGILREVIPDWEDPAEPLPSAVSGPWRSSGRKVAVVSGWSLQAP